MGKSTSCFKIISCGGDSADDNDVDVPESKGSNDKRGWSFRKRSARHRVLSNTVISESPSSVKKESPESPDIHFQPPNNSTIQEKVSIKQCSDEKPQLSTPLQLEVSETVAPTDTESKHDSVPDESVVIVIQAAVRSFLAQRELLKLKNLVKLQAAVRGHLVRRHAVGTLRCVQAIAKMQALVRARRARLSLEKKVDEIDGKDDCSLETSEKENPVTKSNVEYTSIKNLLSNRFARQLMESTPKTKPIHISADPAKPGSAWNWLERWMSASSAEPTPKPESTIEQPEKLNDENFASPVGTIIPSEVICDLADSKSSARETVVLPSESEGNLITCDTEKFNFQPCQSTSSLLRDDLELPQPEATSTSDVKEISIEINCHQSQSMQSDAASQAELTSLPSNPEMESERPKHSMKRLASENIDTEGKKFVFGSKKASNPAFIAAQSKFEELSLTANSGRSIGSPHQDVSVDSNMDRISSGADTLTKRKELGVAENSAPHYPKVQYVGSECGTELSISSTLDSPDRSEVGATEYEHEAKVSEREICDQNNTNNLDVKASDSSTIPVCDVSHSVVDQPEKVYDVQGESVDSVVVIDSPQVEHKPESSASDLHKELVSETGHQTYRSSPEASPRSHITFPESQGGTPSSQVSVKAKKKRADKKADKSGSSRKRKPLPAGKGSPSNPNQDSGARSSTERLPRDQKSGKRRNSFGLTTDDIDQEPADSSSSSTFPRFMQATESAKAKIQANNSPRSSPDVQERDVHIKKRHSLPAANGRQGSPRIQRSTSQAQQGAKGNSTNPIHERKWQR